MKKKFLTFVLAILVLSVSVFAAACGDGDNGKSLVDVDQLPELTTSEYAGTTIEFMHFWQENEGLLPALAEVFSEKTGINVRVTLSPVATHLTDINTRIQTGNLPALYTMWPGATMPEYINQGVVADLSDLDTDWNKTMSATAREACTVNGKLYIAPINVSVMGILYNKAIFREHNLSVPKNLADFENIMKTIKDNDPNVDYPLIWGADCAANYVYLLALSTLYQKYPDFDEKVTAGTLAFDNEDMKAIYNKLFIEWAEAEYYNAETATSTDRMTRAAITFASGSSAMMRVGAWDLPVLEELMKEGGLSVEYGMFPMPGYDNDGSALAATGEAIALNAMLSERERGAAIEFLNFLLSPYCNARICGNINAASPYEGVATKVPDCINEFSTYIDDTARGWTMWPIAVQNVMGECFDIVLAPEAEKTSVLDAHLAKLAGLWA